MDIGVLLEVKKEMDGKREREIGTRAAGVERGKRACRRVDIGGAIFYRRDPDLVCPFVFPMAFPSAPRNPHPAPLYIVLCPLL